MALQDQITVLCRLTSDDVFRRALSQTTDESLVRYGYELTPDERRVVEQTVAMVGRHPELAADVHGLVERPCRANFQMTYALAEAELKARGLNITEDFVQSPYFWSTGQDGSFTTPQEIDWTEKAILRDKYNYMLDCFYFYIRHCIEQGLISQPFTSDVLQYEYDCYALMLRLYPTFEREEKNGALPDNLDGIYPVVTPFAIVRTYDYPVHTMVSDFMASNSIPADVAPRTTRLLFGYSGHRFLKLALTPAAHDLWLRCDGRVSLAELVGPSEQPEPIIQFLRRLFEKGLLHDAAAQRRA